MGELSEPRLDLRAEHGARRATHDGAPQSYFRNIPGGDLPEPW